MNVPVIPVPDGVDAVYAKARQEVLDFYWRPGLHPLDSEPADWTRAHQYAIEDLTGSIYVTWIGNEGEADWYGCRVAYARNLALLGLAEDIGQYAGINPGFIFEFTPAGRLGLK
jgi:hypothetical protein